MLLNATALLGEMVNLQKVNLPKSQLAKKVNLPKKSTCQKSQLAKKVNSLKTPTIAFWLFYAQVDSLASWLFGQLTFWRLTISPRIATAFDKIAKNMVLSAKVVAKIYALQLEPKCLWNISTSFVPFTLCCCLCPLDKSVRGNQLLVSAARWQHGSQICFGTFIKWKITKLQKTQLPLKLEKNSRTAKAIEKIITDLE
jgi:hypothetical protein